VLPRPRLAGDYQFQNAAGVLMALEVLSERLPVSVAAVEQGLRTVSLLGRYTQIDGPVQYVLDVAHNPQAAAALVDALRENAVPGKTHCVLGMLKDKDHRSVIEMLRTEVDSWHVVGLSGPRGAAASQLMEEIAKAGIAVPASRFDSVEAALDALGPIAQPGDRVLIMGSFLTVAGAMRRLNV
jgi:dihydrofolate synthase/folylpolyglutamate synthase